MVHLSKNIPQVQDIVVGNKQFTDVTKPNEIVSLLLNDDELANLENQGSASSISGKRSNKRAAGSTDETSQAVRDLWAEEGDDFFGHSGPAASATITDVPEDDDMTPVPASVSMRGKKRRGPNAGGRGAKAGAGKGQKRKHAGDALPDDL